MSCGCGPNHGACEEAGSGDLTAGADLKQTFFYD